MNNTETWQMHRATSVRRVEDKERAPNVCPCCKQPVEGCPVLVSLDVNTVTVKGRSIRLSAHETEIMHTLAQVWPGRAGNERLIDALYGTHSAYRPESAKILAVYMTHLRKKLKPLGATIENTRGAGYGVVVVN